MSAFSAGTRSDPVGAASEKEAEGTTRAGLRFRFGEFEVQPETGLLQNGHRVRIQDLPFRMLLVLLDPPGQIVSREELRNRLWGESTFVDFDNNLRVAAAKLREALRDSVSEPRYLETIARRGYRFLAPVEVIAAVAPSTRIKSEQALEAAVVLVVATEPNRVETVERISTTLPQLPVGSRRLPLAIAVAATALLLIAAGWMEWRWQHRPLLREGDTVAIGNVRNETGDASLDDALMLAFRIKMEESPFLHAISSEQFERTSQALQAASPDKLSARAAQLSVCASSGGKVLLSGLLRKAGSDFKVRLSAARCSDGQEIASTEASTSTVEGLLGALSEAANAIRLRLGETAAMLGRFDVPVSQATTSSLAALRAFREGEKKHFAGNDLDSREYYKLAIDLDPNFALAYMQLGRSYSNIGETSLSRSYFQKAFELRDRTTDREKLYIATSYYSRGTGELDRSIGAYELWTSLYPHDVVPANNLATEYYLLGDGEKSLAAARHAIEIEPTLPVPYSTLAQALFITGDLRSLTLLCNDKKRDGTTSMGFHLACYKLAVAENDRVRQQHEEHQVQGSPLECPILNEAAEAEAYAGHLQRAREIFKASVDAGRAHALPELAAIIELNGAGIMAELGDSTSARALIAHTLSYAPHGANIDTSAGIVSAILGDSAKARTFAEDAHTLSATDTLLNRAEVPTIYAIVELHAGRPRAALDALEPVRPYDLNTSMELMSVYYRGRALFALGDKNGAIVEFKRLLAHKQESPRSIYILLSELELAKLYAAEGQVTQARELAAVLHETWKTADKQFAPLRELKNLNSTLGD